MTDEPFPVMAWGNVAFSPCSIGEWLVQIVIKKKGGAASNEPVKHSRKGDGGDNQWRSVARAQPLTRPETLIPSDIPGTF